MQELSALITRVAPYVRNILITGETGTGKEVVARAIESIHSIAAAIQQAEGDMQVLRTEANKITGVMKVISEIAEQTNLLALNAAIAITGTITLVVGVYPQLVARIGELAAATL